MTLTQEIKEYGLNLGYSRVGIAPADDFTDFAREVRSRGPLYDFYVRSDNDFLARVSPRHTFPAARSLVVLVWNYGALAFPRELVGRVGRVYQARCYNPPDHYANGARFALMLAFLREKGMEAVVNTALPDRRAGARAGVTTFGKNNFAYADGLGSFIVIRTVMVDAELEYDVPTPDTKCPAGCTRCVDACPSKALYQPFRLDPRRCIAFNCWMTTKERGFGITDSIPRDMRPHMGEMVHGCDVCQEVCPRNQAVLKAKLPDDEFLSRIAREFSLVRLLHLDEEFYRSRVRPIMYNYIADTRTFQRNAAVAIGNTGDRGYLPELQKALDNPDETVREHVVWAMAALGGDEAKRLLREHQRREDSALVKAELALALGGQD